MRTEDSDDTQSDSGCSRFVAFDDGSDNADESEDGDDDDEM